MVDDRLVGYVQFPGGFPRRAAAEEVEEHRFLDRANARPKPAERVTSTDTAKRTVLSLDGFALRVLGLCVLEAVPDDLESHAPTLESIQAPAALEEVHDPEATAPEVPTPPLPGAALQLFPEE